MPIPGFLSTQGLIPPFWGVLSPYISIGTLDADAQAPARVKVHAWA